jgi:hypothetical protein
MDGEASNDCHAGDIGIVGEGPARAALNAATLGEGAKSAKLSDSSSSLPPGCRVSDIILPAVGRVRPRMLSPPETDVREFEFAIRRGRVGVSSISTLMLGTMPIPIPRPVCSPIRFDFAFAGVPPPWKLWRRSSYSDRGGI